MLKKHIMILLAIILLFLSLSPSAHSEQTINRGQMVSDTVPSNSHKVYSLSEQLPKGCIFSIWFRVNEGGYGLVALQKGTETVFVWTVGVGSVIMYAPLPMYYSVFINRNGSYTLNVTSTSFGLGGILNYTFFYDFSDELQANNSKTIPLEGGVASYYVDLRSDDKVSLNLASPSGSDFDMQVFSSYSYLAPSVASTVSAKSPESLSFVAASEGRYFIFVSATTGNGTFNLQSSIAPKASTYEELRARADSLQSALDNIKNVMYILIALAVISVVINVYLATRKPSVKTETKT